MAVIPFGEWRPDVPARDNPGATIAKNVIPYASHYGPFHSIAPFSGAIDSRCQGGFSALASDATVTNFVGDAGKLYALNNATFGDVSKGGGYTTLPEERWVFQQFGQNVIASNFSDPIQSYVLGSSSQFADLAGSPPNARYLAIVGNHLVTGNVEDSGGWGTVPNGVWWSGFDNISTWAPSATTRAGRQPLESGQGGWIMGIVGGDYGIVFQERSIWRMQPVGGRVIFSFDEIEPGRGTPAPGSIAYTGRTIFYLGQDGFYVFNGQSSTRIGSSVADGAGKVDQFFFSDANIDYLSRMVSAVDNINKLYMVSYASNNSPSAVNDRMLIYNWAANKWSYVELGVQTIYNSLSNGYTLEQLDNISTDVDALPFSLDNRIWNGGASKLAVFDSSGRLGYFEGSTLEAQVATGEFQLTNGMRSFMRSLRAMIDTDQFTVSIGAREKQYDPITWSDEMAPDASGRSNFSSDARYHRARLTIEAGANWTKAQGIDDLDFEASSEF